MVSSGKRSFQYGRWEMRGKVPALAGMWPAWWALGNSGEWPSNGEIDMMEFYNGAVHANMACGTATRSACAAEQATESRTEARRWRMEGINALRAISI